VCPCPRTCVHVQAAAVLAFPMPHPSQAPHNNPSRPGRCATFLSLLLTCFQSPAHVRAGASFLVDVDLSLDSPSSSSISSSFPLLPPPFPSFLLRSSCHPKAMRRGEAPTSRGAGPAETAAATVAKPSAKAQGSSKKNVDASLDETMEQLLQNTEDMVRWPVFKTAADCRRPPPL
jgi:hypothetical protein